VDKKIDEALYIVRLIRKQNDGTISPEEVRYLRDWLAADREHEKMYRKVMDTGQFASDLLALEQYDADAMAQRIFNKAGLELPEEQRIPTLKRPSYFRYWAAAAALLFFSFASWYLVKSNTYQPVNKKNEIAIRDQVIPGSNKAVLTLADNSRIELDSASHSLLKQQGNNSVVQLQNGLIAYDTIANHQLAAAWNTITTPKGVKYEVVLSDGTRVFLNSASSLKFPVSFPDSSRVVVLTGEAYFEVAHLPAKDGGGKPFYVKISLPGRDGGEVKVLGTHFNIMAYDDENAVKTTLLSGAVSMRKGDKEVLLKPGQQAVLSNSGLQVKEADMEEALAWKNGKFLFRAADIAAIMRQISRWYDIDVQYEGDMSGIRFSGDFLRKENVKEFLDILEAEGRLHFAVTGRQVRVSSVSK
jgi:ferric-dicitrate binding protein FerR (iron transport regulator)